MAISPKDLANDGFQRAENLLTTARRQNDISADLGRMALVMAVSALDTYVHKVVFDSLRINRSSLPQRLMKLDIPLGDFVNFANRYSKRQTSVRPWAAVTRSFQERILTESFQSPRKIADALAMAGAKKVWKNVAKELHTSANAIEEKLNTIVHRRNQIVHEGDVRRLVRPRTIQHNPVHLDEISEMVLWLRRLVDALDTVVGRQLKIAGQAEDADDDS